MGKTIPRTALAQERRSSNEATHNRSELLWQKPGPRNRERYNGESGGCNRHESINMDIAEYVGIETKDFNGDSLNDIAVTVRREICASGSVRRRGNSSTQSRMVLVTLDEPRLLSTDIAQAC